MTTQAKFTVGYDITSVGKGVRLILGVILPITFTAQQLLRFSHPARFYWDVALYFAGELVVYVAAHQVLGQRVLARMNPWIGTVLLVGPAVVVPFLPFLPATFRVAMALYISLSTLVNVFISYGGCEVLGIPSLIFRRRYVVYCPWNVFDAAERAIVRRQAA